jgi:formate hydrogenlyase transcriptional activator
VVPLTTARRRLGALGVGSQEEHRYERGEVEFLQQVSKQVAVAVDNVLNFESAEAAQQALARERDRLNLLLEINNAVVSHLELRELLKTISSCLGRVIPHDLAGLTRYDPATHQLVAHALDFPRNQDFAEAGVPIPLEGTPEGLAFTSRQTVLLKKLNLTEFHAEIVKRAAAEGLKSGCAVPLMSRGRALGTLSVVSLQEAAFTEDDAVLLSRIGTQVAIAVENGLAYRELADLKDKLNKEKRYLEDEIRTEHNFEEIIGESASLNKVLKQVKVVAPTDSTVLILGETGTGKELLARAIHNLSGRRERTFVKMNCAAIPTGLLESELFGHERGAFTGAIATKVGRFELADGGTLFLDEVGDIPLELQSKLLRVLQEQEFERLGSTRTLKVNVRLVAATNQDLSDMVKRKEFRSDLYYRLNVFPLMIPPLRERRDDIPLLVRHFAQKFARQLNRPIERIPAETMGALMAYAWPGNIRELENLIERAVILSQETELHVPIAELAPSARDRTQPTATLDATEREHILRVLKAARWVIGGPSGAAAQLGMKRTTLQSKMQKLGITRPI